MSEASSAFVAVGAASPTTLPSRMTVMRSATARTSRSLCVMKTIEVPSSRSCRMIAISSSVSCGVSTAVGSSNTSTFASRDSALMISTRCCTPTGRSPTSASGSTWKPKRLATSRTCWRALGRSRESQGLGVLVPEHDVLGDGEDRDQHEVLVHHADARPPSHRPDPGSAARRRRGGSRPHRPGRGRTGRSSAWTCRRRSRRGGRGSRRAGPRDRCGRWRRDCRTAW